MKTNFKMKEALNAKEAITSILDVVEHNPVWLNKCTDYLTIMVANLNKENRKFILNNCTDEEIIDLFVSIKTEYHKFDDNSKEPKKMTQWN